MSALSHPYMKAASEDLSYLRMEEDLTCPVCLELYADPLMLPCSHSVCKKCLADIVHARIKAGKEGLECPSCRDQHSLSEDHVEKLPRNLALENIVFRFQELQSSTISKSKSLDLSATSPTNFDLSLLPLDCDQPVFADEAEDFGSCGLCEGGKERAVWFCGQCSVLYCQQCLDSYHPKRGSLQHHRLTRPAKVAEVTAAREALTFCGDHGDEATHIFCWGCQVLVCHLCVCEGTGQHAGHKILDLDSALRQMKESLGMCKERLEAMMAVVEERRVKTEQLIQEIEAIHSSVRDKVELQYERLLRDVTQALTTHKAGALRHLDSVRAARLDACSAHAALVNSQSQQLSALSQRCKDLLNEESRRQVLQGCGHRPLVSDQVQELETQHNDLASTHKQLCSDRDAISKLRCSIVECRSAAFDLLRKFAGDSAEKCLVVTPTIRSVKVASPGKADAPSSPEGPGPAPSCPRAGNRTLISWGFNSTTFTAEPLTQSSQWSVAVEKNTSKIGNIHSGYLFGIGISHETLSSKDQVGMTTSSAGIVCSNGSLVFCHNGKTESLLALDQLPVSVTLCSSLAGDNGVIFSYMLSLPGWSRCLTGKVVLPDPAFKVKVFPVFTVSQRVKLQFPTSSTV